MANIPSFKINASASIPVIGLGTYNEENEQVLVNAIKAAVQSGYRHFDCAYFYNNEQHIGKGISEAIKESNGQLKREDFFIVSKVWNNMHSKAKVRECLNTILSRLQVDYLDLYLIHWPMSFKEDGEPLPLGPDGKMILSDIHYLETYQAMEELVNEGKIKFIGVSNFNQQQINEVLKVAKIRPICNQVEIHPLFQNTELVEFCQKNDIIPVAYAPLGSPPYCDRPNERPKDAEPLKNPQVLELAKKYNKTPAQIILRWLIQRKIVVIPKSVTPTRISENIQLFDFELTSDEMNIFKSFKEQFRFNYFDTANNSPFYPF